MADLSSILGGMVQGFKDFGTGLVDFFGTGAANIGDIASSIATGRATTKNQDDFRKWLYQTDDKQDAAAKGLGTILNGVSTVADFIPGAQAVTANPLFNGIQGAIGGVSDELKMAGKDADWGRAAQRAGVGAASGLASGYAGQALGKSSNKLLSNGLTRGAVSGALGGGIANAGYTGIEGGSVQDMINAGLYGAQTGALVGGTTGLARELIKPTRKMDARLTDAERQARIENAQAQIDELGPVPLFSDDPEYVAKRARKLELNDAIKAYRSGYDTVDEYNAAMAAKRANKREYKAPEAQYAPIIGEEVMLDATQAPEGYTRLYRGLENEFDPKYVPQVSDNGYGYESWSDTYDLAREYAGPDGNVYTVDVPNSRIATQTVTPDGERMPVVKTDKKAGMKSFDGERFIDGKEYLLNVNDPLRQELTYSKVRAKNVADLMNEPKQKTVADLMLSPDDDVIYSKAEGPIEIRQDSSNLSDRTKRALELITNQNTPAENELYNKIDPSTLPAGYDKLRNLLDNKTVIDEKLEKSLGKNPMRAEADELLDYLYPNEPIEKKVYYKSLKESIEKYKQDAAALGVDASKAEEDMTRNKRLELVKKAYDKAKFDTLAEIGKGIDIGDDLLYATQAYTHRGIRTGYPGALDTALSERLGIAPGNTIKITDSAYDYLDRETRGKNAGRYTREPKDISIREGIQGIEGDISTMAHERLHSFQNEASPENAGRYSKEVADAYNELAKDLKPYIKSDNEIKKLYKGDSTEYYAKPIEQEARMLQAYLDSKGITDNAQYWHNKSIGGQPEWGDEINPAFDKFFDKLRALSKKGVALPALTALFGGGAIMAATQGDDKKKKSEVK